MAENTKRELLLTPASQIRTRRQKWLWDGRIPLGTVTIFAGRGGEGKSTFALHVGAEAIAGKLPGDLLGEPTSFAIISHEDDWSTVMKPRLLAAHADPEHVFKVTVRATEDETTHEMVPMLPLDIDFIREAIVASGARLIMIDPISSTLTGDHHKVADVRKALDPLASLAQELEVAVIAVMHFNKGAGNVSDKLSGSHAFRDLSRSVLLFATDDETGQRIVSVDKSNYSADRGSSFAFNLNSVEIDTDDGFKTTVAQVEYLGDTDMNVADIVNREHAGGDDEERNSAQAFLLDWLKTKPEAEAAAKDVLRAARDAGFSEQDMKNARRRCKNPSVKSEKSTFGGGWVWRISHEGVSQGAQGATLTAPDTFDTFVAPSPDALPTSDDACRVCGQGLWSPASVAAGLCAKTDRDHEVARLSAAVNA